MKNWINKRKIVGIILTLCMLLSSLTVFADEVSSVGYTLYQYSQVEEAIQAFESTKPELLEAYKQDFPTESGWWDEYAIMPILTGVISGYPDGTIKPNNPVTGGEFAKMIATAFEGYIPSGGSLDNKSFDGKWYNNYYNVMAKAFPYNSSQLMQVEFMESPMVRAEVAYVIAKIIDSEGLEAYINKVQNNDFSTMGEYSDFSQHVWTSDEYFAPNGRYEVVASYYSSRAKKMFEHGYIPMEQGAAIMLLKDRGIMVGDGAGHISPMGNVTRAEIFKLITECCKATKDYTKHKFLGWENWGRDFYTDAESKALPWVYSLDQVINPEAEEKYQYTFGDLKWGDTTKSYEKSNQHLVMSGQHNRYNNTEIYQRLLSDELSKKLVDEVFYSYSKDGNIIKIYIPDLKSKYHQISVSFHHDNGILALNSAENPGWNEINLNEYSHKQTDYTYILISCGGYGNIGTADAQYKGYINYVTGETDFY